MATTLSTMPSLLTLPTEVLQHILRYVLDGQHQAAPFCTCDIKRRQKFNEAIREEYRDKKLELRLINKTFDAAARDLTPGSITAFVCSADCLRRFLAELNGRPRTRDRLQTVAVKDRRRLSVEVSKGSKAEIRGRVKTWSSTLGADCLRAAAQDDLTIELDQSRMLEWWEPADLRVGTSTVELRVVMWPRNCVWDAW